MARHPLARGGARGGGAALSAAEDELPEDEGPIAAALAGCCGFSGPRREYFEQLSLVELQDTFRASPREATLTRWRDEAPPGFVFTLRASQLITHEGPTAAGLPGAPAVAGQHGMLRPTPAVRLAYEQTLAVAQRLDARALLFETPVDFTPTATNRKNLAAFFSSIPRDDRLLVWLPQGVWADGEVLRICADLDLVPATTIVSPEPELELPRRYFRLNAPRITEDELWLLADQMRDCDIAYCLFNGPSMRRDAQRLQALLDPA